MAKKEENANQKSGGDKISAPNVSLPGGGGAIRGVGETFQPDTFSGTGSLSIPVYTSPSRGFEPDISLNYNSGSGNGTFGIGFSLSLSKISRRTEKGIPKYDDTDIFILAAEGELVPGQIKRDNRWMKDIRIETEADGSSWRICRYVPRIEGTFSNIEYCTNEQTGESYWKVISKDNVTSIYGASEAARIVNPADRIQVFEWLVEKIVDARGNTVIFTYKPENADHVPRDIYEVNRSSTANKYIQNIKYGNYIDRDGGKKFAFELVFDYGERNLSNLDKAGCDPYSPVNMWACRRGPFSSFRSGFEIRTYRLCQNILMFHHFEKELGETPCLVRSTRLNYKQTRVISCLESVEVTGHRREADGSYESQKMPPLEFNYSQFNPPRNPRFKKLEIGDKDGTIPGYLESSQFLPVDLYREGVPGFLYSNKLTTLYFEPEGEGKYSVSRTPREFPLEKEIQRGEVSLVDLEGDGQLELVVNNPSKPGYYQNRPDGSWEKFLPFPSYPTNMFTPTMEQAGLAGNGKTDLLEVGQNNITVYPSRGKQGYDSARLTPRENDFPLRKAEYREELVTFADIFGDGLPHRIKITNGCVQCWPNLGYGRFAAKVTFGNAPCFDTDLDIRRIYLADIDGSGAADLVYVYPDRIKIYLNQSGNSFSEPITIMLPEPYSEIDRISFTDISGNGTTSLVFTKIAPLPRHYYFDFKGEIEGEEGEAAVCLKPYLLTEINNNLGAVTQIQYCSSTKFYLKDKKTGRPWVTKLPFPVQVVERVVSIDNISGSRSVNTFKYHDGYYDPVEREFRGFGYVETRDTETYEEYEKSRSNPGFPVERLNKELYVPPVYTRSWYHTGAYIEEGIITKHYREEYFRGDSGAYNFPDSVFQKEIYEQDSDTVKQAYAALKGRVLRREVYAEDKKPESANPYSVEESNVEVVLRQAKGDQSYAVFMVNPRQSIAYHYERNPEDPRVEQRFTLEVDDFGNITRSCTVFLPRRERQDIHPEQRQLKATANLGCYINETDSSRWIGVNCQAQEFEIFGLDLKGGPYFGFDEIKSQMDAALQNRLPYEGELTANTLQTRQLTWNRTFYWSENQTEALPPGRIASRGLLHHRAEAVFTKEFITDVFAGKLTDDTIRGEGGYFYDEETGYWWNRGLVQHYFKEPAGFYMPCKTENSFADPSSTLFSKTTAAYDPYFLSPVKVTRYIDETDPARIIKNVETVELDYITLQPKQLIDINNNVSQVLFDPLGQVIVSSLFGTEDGEEMGGMRIYPYEGKPAEYKRRLTTKSGKPVTFDDVLDELKYYLQGAASFFYYNLFAWKEHNQPTCAINLLREEYYHTTKSTTSAFSCTTSIAYSDGFGRELETKLKVDPGIAIIRDAQGKLALDQDNKPLQAETQDRWQVSGRTVYNNKGKPCEQYLPYFSNTPYYETQKEIVDEKLVPPPTVIHYDPLLRVIRTDTPKGFFSRVAFTPWEERHYDEGDTVKDSPYYIDFMKHYPPDPTQAQKDAKDALDKAAALYDTPGLNMLDSRGSRFLQIEHLVNPLDETESVLPTYYRVDIQGRVVEAIDPRLYQANITGGTAYYNFRYRYAMAEENPLSIDSADAGKQLHFSNIFGNLIWSLSPRNFDQIIAYDRLQRRVEVEVKKINEDGTVAADNVVELYTYGETQTDPEDNNLRGQVFRLIDLSGIVTNSRYSMKGEIQQSSRQLTADYKAAVNWDDQVTLEPDRYTTQFHYDALSRLISQTTPDGTITTNAYNRAGLLDTVILQYKDGTEQPIVNHIEYNANQQRLQITYENGVTTTYTYEDTTLRLIKLYSTRPVKNSRESVIQNIVYTYDPVGNITRTRDHTFETVFCNNQQVEPLSDYTYDSLYRLLKANGRQHPGINSDTYVNNKKNNDFKQSKFGYLCPPNVNDQTHLENYSELYTYDDGGNLVKKQHQASSSSWSMATPVEDNSNRLKDREYDASGNLRQINLNSAVSLTFNCCENLIKAGVIERPDEPDDCDYYNYDSDEIRTRKVSERLAHGGSVTEKEEKIYLGNYEIKRIKSETAEGETTILYRQTLRVMDDKTCVAIMHYWIQDDLHREVEKAGTRKLRYQLDNNLGSVSLEVDDDAALISYEEYFPYGGTAIIAGNNRKEVALKEYRYSGKERDDSTGLYYYGARYYAPWLGRWLKPDPAGPTDGLNLYAFVGGNPISKIDSEGNWGVWATLAGTLTTLGIGGGGGYQTGHGMGTMSGIFMGVAAGALGAAVGATLAGVGLAGIGAAALYGAGTAIAGAVVGGAVGRAVMRGTSALGAPPLVTSVTGMVTSGTSGALLGGMISGYSKTGSLAVGIATGIGSAVLSSGAHLGLLGMLRGATIDPVELTDSSKIVKAVPPSSVGSQLLKNRKLLVMAPKKEAEESFSETWDQGKTLSYDKEPNEIFRLQPFSRTGDSLHTVIAHGSRGYIMVPTGNKGGVMRPMSIQNFAEYVKGELGGGNTPIKFISCFGGATGFNVNAQILANITGREVYAYPGKENPAFGAFKDQQWKKFSPNKKSN